MQSLCEMLVKKLVRTVNAARGLINKNDMLVLVWLRLVDNFSAMKMYDERSFNEQNVKRNKSCSLGINVMQSHLHLGE